MKIAGRCKSQTRTVTKADLITIIADKLKFPLARAELLVDMVFGSMEQSMSRGEKIEMRATRPNYPYPYTRPMRGLSRKAGAVFIMASGTSGPARAVRHRPTLRQILHTVTAILDQLHPKRGEPTLLTIPLPHGHGLATLGMSLGLDPRLGISGLAHRFAFARNGERSLHRHRLGGLGEVALCGKRELALERMGVELRDVEHTGFGNRKAPHRGTILDRRHDSEVTRLA